MSCSENEAYLVSAIIPKLLSIECDYLLIIWSDSGS